MNKIRKPIIDYMEYDSFNTWSSSTSIALDNLIYEIKKKNQQDSDLEETLQELVRNIYIEAFRDGTEFRRWLDFSLI